MENKRLNWSRQDIEQRLFFPGAPYTSINSALAAILGAIGTLVFFSAIYLLNYQPISDFFTRRGFVPYTLMFLFNWCMAMIVIKWFKIRLQRRALKCQIVPEAYDFAVTTETAGQVLNQLHRVAADPEQFILLHRISIALANLKNIGRIGDVDDILRSQAETDESSMQTSYSLLSGFIWAIPVLGFIGTVLGLSNAIGGFGAVLQTTGADMDTIKPALMKVTGGLSTAFDTTLLALVAAVIVQLLVTFLRKSEETFLDECRLFCLRNIVNRTRVVSASDSTSSDEDV